MGLFTSKKNLCPICGSPTPRLLATKVEGMPICKACDNKIDIPYETVQAMTVEEFQGYLSFYDENEALRTQFRNEYTLDVNGWSDEVQIDFTHGLFRVADKDSSIVYEGKCIHSFRILEDNCPLYEGSASGLRCSASAAPEYLERLWPMFNDYQRDQREYERMRAVAELADRDRDRDRGAFYREMPQPRFDVAKPVQQYHIIITMDHPYRTEFRGELDGPDFGTLSPDLMETTRKYDNLLQSLDMLAQNLMRLFAPDAPLQRQDGGEVQTPQTAPAAPAAPANDTVTELRRFKELLDQGIITEEEFAAKKKQLLGI